MTLEARACFGIAALEGAVETSALAIRDAMLLRTEILKGKCQFVTLAENSYERVVFVVQVRLQRDDGHVLVQLKKESTEETKVRCSLPGFSALDGELPHETLK